MSNPAALNGWVKSTDPNTGRVFYANHITRVTQWEPPPGWNDAPQPPKPPITPKIDESSSLPPGWEEMKDPTTGRSFYVDHARQITTWTRPVSQNTDEVSWNSRTQTQSSASFNSRPTTVTSTRQTGYQQQQQPQYPTIVRSNSNVSHVSASRRTWTDDTSYFRPSSNYQDFDFSDSMSKLDFKVQKVEDQLRLSCGGCQELFTLSKRRHHCRLCGDVFCHECSPHKTVLPLEGPEFEKPVRICSTCYPEVEQGNYFSLRRYLTPLILYNPPTNERALDQEQGVATAQTVSAALCALTSDFDAMILNGEVNGKLTIDPEVLVPAITKHLTLNATSDRAVRAIASLLSLAAIINNTSWAIAVYNYGGKAAIDSILILLERSGSDRRTLFVQEQAAKTIFYLTDAAVLKQVVLQGINPEFLDLPRAMRAMIDHSSNSKNPNLQRWAASSLRHLVCEDERRTTSSVNDIAAYLAAGMDYEGEQYESFLPELINSGGILILCTLMGADDADTRAHATGALGATLFATRATSESLSTLFEMTSGRAGRMSSNADGDIIRSIVQGGGCGSSLSFLLQSAENGVARMGIDFCASLVMPLLIDARGTATLTEGYNCLADTSSLGACREAAKSIASGPCFPALLGIVRDQEMGGRLNRPMEMKKIAMETLAATVMGVGEMSKANPVSLDDTLHDMIEEGVLSVMLSILQSSSSQTLSSQDTPSSRIRECAGIVISSLSMCSVDAMMELQSCHAITSMLQAMGDVGSSTLRGDAAPKCLGMLQTAAALLTFTQHDESSDTDLVDRLLEAVDAGAISSLSRILFTKIEWESQDKAVGAMKARDAACRMLTAMFGMAQSDEMAHQRLWDVVNADAYSRNPPRTIVTGTLGVLQAAGKVGRSSLLGDRTGPHFHAAVMDLIESSLYAVGSMCGSTVVPGLEHIVESVEMMEQCKGDDDFAARRKEACAVACDILTARSRNSEQSILPTMLVGGFGEKALTAALRLTLAICQNGGLEQHAKLAGSGILVPISDLMKSSMSAGNQFRFSACLALVRFCGPHVGADVSGGLPSVQAAIRTATYILAVPTDPNAPIEQTHNTEALKAACIQTLESLSNNSSLWSAISKDALPSIVGYLQTAAGQGTGARNPTLCGALRAIARIVALQSHAIAASRAGLAEPLGRLLIQSTSNVTYEGWDQELPLLALEVLHVLASKKDARKDARLLESGVIEGVCRILAMSATGKPDKPTDSRADLCFWALEILLYFIEDLGNDFQSILDSPLTRSFIEIISGESGLIQSFCATYLLTTRMKIPKFDSETEEMLDIPRHYGSPLILVEDSCYGFKNTHVAAMNVFYIISYITCALECKASEMIWRSILFDDQPQHSESRQVAATFCALLLKMLSDEKSSPLIPVSTRKRDEFEKVTRPLVRYALLEGIKASCGEHIEGDYMISMLVAFEVPRCCLSIWQDPNLADLSFDIIKLLVDAGQEDLVHVFIDSKATLLSLFEMLHGSSDLEKIVEVRRVVANLMATIAENGLLTDAVKKYDIKSEAIAALAAACLADEQGEDDDKLATAATLSSRCMECLVDLLKGKIDQGIQLESKDAESIAKRLGEKICRMVISRFLERAKLSHYDLEAEENVMEAPDVKMLCALAQHEDALDIISSLGGVSALCLIAGEGDYSAITALKKVKAENLIQANGHHSILKMLLDHHSLSSDTEKAALELLSELTNGTEGRQAFVELEEFPECIEYTLRIFGITSDELEVKEESCDAESHEDEGGTMPSEEVESPPSELVPIPGYNFDTIIRSAGLSLLTNFVSFAKCRQILFSKPSFMSTIANLAKEYKDTTLQYQAVRMIVSLSPYATVSGVSVAVDALVTCIVDVLTFSSPTATKSLAAEGLHNLFSSASSQLQIDVMKAVSNEFMAGVKRTTVSRSAESESEKIHTAQFVCCLTSLIVQASPLDFLRSMLCYNEKLLQAVVHLIEWRYDSPGQSPLESYSVYWDAATSFCIQHCAFVFCGTIESQESVNTVELKKTVLTMARPGKAPRKTCNLKTALERAIAAKRDVTGAFAAQRILSRMS
jgi:FYVE zinc finger/WW domain